MVRRPPGDLRGGRAALRRDRLRSRPRVQAQGHGRRDHRLQLHAEDVHAPCVVLPGDPGDGLAHTLAQAVAGVGRADQRRRHPRPPAAPRRAGPALQPVPEPRGARERRGLERGPLRDYHGPHPLDRPPGVGRLADRRRCAGAPRERCSATSRGRLQGALRGAGPPVPHAGSELGGLPDARQRRLRGAGAAPHHRADPGGRAGNPPTGRRAAAGVQRGQVVDDGRLLPLLRSRRRGGGQPCCPAQCGGRDAGAVVHAGASLGLRGRVGGQEHFRRDGGKWLSVAQRSCGRPAVARFPGREGLVRGIPIVDGLSAHISACMWCGLA
mmetsp:Transcript_5273/g.14922  ORF Transcript_5273/g.14922 Transcript_5273/m.14922 type:complete len:325 (+) Transcript_5273:1278-2252(+)